MTGPTGKKALTKKYCPRFGQLGVHMGFITEEQLKAGLACQVHEELCGQGHRLLGAILFDKDWMSASQVDKVMTELLHQMRSEDA